MRTATLKTRINPHSTHLMRAHTNTREPFETKITKACKPFSLLTSQQPVECVTVSAGTKLNYTNTTLSCMYPRKSYSKVHINKTTHYPLEFHNHYEFNIFQIIIFIMNIMDFKFIFNSIGCMSKINDSFSRLHHNIEFIK